MIKNTILIIGAKGMLGKELAETFSDAKPLLWDREDIDIANERDVREKINSAKPALIINAAALTDVDACETKHDAAFAVNGHAVGFLAEAAREAGAAFVHYSTDYVFDGTNEEGCREDDEPHDPVNVYGASKLLGEQLLRKAGERGLQFYLIRTSWLFGRHGKNFVRTMLELAKTHDELNVVGDQYGKPTYAKDLAASTRALVEESHPSGIYHIVNEPETTWCDFAREIFFAEKELHPEFSAPTVQPCASSAFPRPARRPQHSALLNTKFLLLRPWREALREYLAA